MNAPAYSFIQALTLNGYRSTERSDVLMLFEPVLE